MFTSCRKGVQNRKNPKMGEIKRALLNKMSANVRPFLLLEILIALTLLLLCAYPLSRIPVVHYSAEMAALERLERQK